jgi:hypothetical protein
VSVTRRTIIQTSEIGRTAVRPHPWPPSPTPALTVVRGDFLSISVQLMSKTADRLYFVPRTAEGWWQRSSDQGSPVMVEVFVRLNRRLLPEGCLSEIVAFRREHPDGQHLALTRSLSFLQSLDLNSGSCAQPHADNRVPKHRRQDRVGRGHGGSGRRHGASMPRKASALHISFSYQARAPRLCPGRETCRLALHMIIVSEPSAEATQSVRMGRYTPARRRSSAADNDTPSYADARPISVHTAVFA